MNRQFIRRKANNSSKTVSKNCVRYFIRPSCCYNFSLVSKTSPCPAALTAAAAAAAAVRAAQEDGLELVNKKQYPDAEDQSVCPIAHFNRAVLRL